MKPYMHLGEYSADQRSGFNALLDLSIEHLPFTLSYPVGKFTQEVKNEDYGRAMNYALDFFEIAVQYMSCLLLAFLREKADLCAGNEVLSRAVSKIDTKRPLSFGDWINDIFNPLVNVAAAVIPDDPLVASLSRTVVTKKYNLLLGNKKEPSIVQIRNDYRGHTTTLSQNIYRGVIYTLEPRLYKMLEAMAPLREWLYFSHKEQTGEDRFRIKLLNGNGLDREEVTATESPFVPHHYYVRKTDGAVVDLFPLVFVNESDHVYVFHTLKNESISYISSHEDAETYNGERWIEALDRFLQALLPSFDVSKELNWSEIGALARQTSMGYINQAYKEKKYNQELFVDRSALSAVFSSFRDSEKNLFPLLGEAGQGKTNQLCYWTESLMEQGKTVLIFNSAGFSEAPLDEKLKTAFGVTLKKPVGKLLDNIHDKAATNNESVYLFFDAVNECLSYKGHDDVSENAPLKLYRDICSMLVNEGYPRFKVLFTCRSYTWKNQLQPFIGEESRHIFEVEDEEEISVRGFTDGELEKAYGIYGQLYQMGTPFEKVDTGCRIRLKDPLALKIACTNYLGIELPSSTLSYSSISLFGKMLSDISRSYAGNGQSGIIKGLTAFILQEYEKGTPADSIPVDVLRKAYDDDSSSFHQMARLIFKKDGITVAYGELLNKPERPILRLVEEENGGGRIQFIYERFLEYMLAMIFVERERQGMPDSSKAIPAQVYLDELRHAGSNVVFMGAMRNALIMDYVQTGDHSVVLELVKDFGDNYEVMLLVSETMNVLIRENYEEALFSLIGQLLGQHIPGEELLISRFNEADKKIGANQADDTVIREHNELYRQLVPTIRLRKLASVSTVNGMILTDFFAKGLYRQDPMRLLWALMTDPIDDVRNDTCMYVYYLSNKTHTLEYSRIAGNLTEQIVRKVFADVVGTPVAKLLVSPSVRQRSIVLMEAAIRLATLLIIDTSLSGREDKGERIEALIGEIKAVLRHFTWNFRLLRLMMPFFNIILRKQLTFQAAYVNNVIEYQTFWDDSIMPVKHPGDGWDRESMKELLPFLYHYGHHAEGTANDLPDFSQHHGKVLSAYTMGDSFSYFAIERLLVIVGACDWNYIRPVVTGFFSDEYRRNEWFDYSQMSMLYVLFQLTIHSPESNEEILAVFSREAEDWTRRCLGLFRGHRSHKANPSQLYKRNVMNWYCVVYCRHSGDGAARPGDERCVPVFYKLIDEAMETGNKELLYHLIDNISELISDHGYILTALELLKYILRNLESEEKVAALDSIRLERDGIFGDDIVTLVGKVLGTAKNYFPAEVDNFMKKEMAGLKFPGVSKYREEIMNYNPSGESLSDLFTHKFGNYLMWALLNEQAVDEFADEAMGIAAGSPDCFKWFDQVIRLLFMRLFQVRL